MSKPSYRFALRQLESKQRTNSYLHDENEQLREKIERLTEELVKAHYHITRWSRASQIVGSHRSCGCAVCDALYKAAEESKE